MICIYEKTTSDFNNNGLGTLEPIECTFKPVINGVWILEMTLPYDAEGKSQLIANDRILKVTDIDCISEQTAQYQLFRIYDFKKEDNYISVIAYPIGLDARFDTFVDSVKMNYKTASQAITQMNGLSSKYTVSGSGYDATVKSAEYENANLISILNGDNGFVQVWDGEICYDNYNIRVNHRLGSSSNPLDVRYGKNITGMSYDMDASNVITQLYPKSKDGNPLEIQMPHFVRNYVNAPNLTDYPIPHMYYVQAPFNLVQLSNDGSQEYLMSADVFDHIKTLTAEWLNKALSHDEIYGGLLKEIELDWINNNYDLTMIKDGVQGIVEYLWRKLIGSSHANITHGAVQSLIYNAMKAGFDDVLKNSDSGYYIGSTSKKLMDTGFGTQFYSYEWDVAGQYRVTPDGEGYVWVYASSKWNQLDTNGETTGATDKTKWKWYKVKGKTYKRYGNKKKNRYLKSQWWKINDIWYWFDANGKGLKGSALNSMYYEYFEDAEIMLDGEQQTIYDVLSDVCSSSESQLVGLLNNQMEQYCLNLFENEKLSYPTEKLDINMVDLSQTTEYKDFQSLERIHLGDSVKVYNPRLGIESTVRVIGLTYDVLRKMNTEIQIGVTETSVINLLNNIGKGSDEVRYVAGDGITIENNTISVIPPTKPYLEDVLLNGESVVKNHKAYIDLDELGISSVEVLNGEDTPDHEDGDDEDIYLLMADMDDNDFVVTGTKGYGTMDDAVITKVAKNKFTAELSGIPTAFAYEPEDEIAIWLGGLVEGETYTANIKFQFGSSTRFYSGDNGITLGELGSENATTITLANNRNEQTFSVQFTAGQVNTVYFGFHAVTDNVRMTATCTCEITGTLKKIKNVYYKIGEDWYKDNNVRNVVDKDGDSVVDENGVAYIPKSASSVAELTDVDLTNLADGQILKYNATEQKWLNAVESGGGGGSNLILDAQIYSLEEKQVGVWVDNKPLYQFTYDAGSNINVSYNSWTNITINELKGSESIVMGYGTNDGGTYTPLQVSWTGSVENKTIQVQTSRNSNNQGVRYFTFLYTKTTDSAGSGGYQAYGFSPIIYSEEEREVGVWIDNKPLYAKTITFSEVFILKTANQWFSTTIQRGDEEQIIKVEGTNIASTYSTAYSDLSGAFDEGVLQLLSHGYSELNSITIYYTKTTDVAGSGSYNTLGVPTVHYDTTEQVIGTFLGKPLYQKIIDWSSSPVHIPSTWFTTTIDSTNIERVIDCKGHHADGTFYTTDADPTGNNHTKLKMRNNGGGGTYSYVNLRYTKIND